MGKHRGVPIHTCFVYYVSFSTRANGIDFAAAKNLGDGDFAFEKGVPGKQGAARAIVLRR